MDSNSLWSQFSIILLDLTNIQIDLKILTHLRLSECVYLLFASVSLTYQSLLSEIAYSEKETPDLDENKTIKLVQKAIIRRVCLSTVVFMI